MAKCFAQRILITVVEKLTLSRTPYSYLLVLAGFNLILLNFILVQHMAVALRQAEVAVILFSLSYFLGISLGIIISDRIQFSRSQGRFFLFFLAQMSLIIFLQPAFYLLSKYLNQGVAYGATLLFVSLFSTAPYAIFLPRAVQGRESGGLARLYSLEIIGSVIALLSVPILASVSHEMLLGTYFFTFLVICILLKMNRLGVAAMSGFLLLYLCYSDILDKRLAAWFYGQNYRSASVDRVIYTRYTPYHKIEIVALKNDQKMLLLNGKRQFSTASSAAYAYYMAGLPISLLHEDPRVCVLGCGSMATVGQIGARASSIMIVDLDESVFKASKRFFGSINRLESLSNWTFVADDAKHYLANDKNVKFDLILHDIPPARSRQTALTYTSDFFKMAKERLTPKGIFAISVLTPLSGESDYGRKVIATLAHVFDEYFVVDCGGMVYFYGGTDDMEKYSRERCVGALNFSSQKKPRVLLKDEVLKAVAGEEVITINNVGDLIFE